MSRPVLTDRDGWAFQLLEHRRALFERVIQAFPDIQKTKATQVDYWRIKLKPQQALKK